MGFVFERGRFSREPCTAGGAGTCTATKWLPLPGAGTCRPKNGCPCRPDLHPGALGVLSGLVVGGLLLVLRVPACIQRRGTGWAGGGHEAAVGGQPASAGGPPP